jgi:hypothetical protein
MLKIDDVKLEFMKSRMMKSKLVIALGGKYEQDPRLRDWYLEHYKAYQTPTILLNWLYSLPAPLAVELFDESDVCLIEMAYISDSTLEMSDEIPMKMKALCFAYLELTTGRCQDSWVQGRKAVTESGPLRMRQCRALAIKLHQFATQIQSSDYSSCSEYAKRFIGRRTSDLEGINFSGEIPFFRVQRY